MIEFNVELPKNKTSKEELIDELKKLSKQLKKNKISVEDIEKYSQYSHSTYRNYFGSLREALQCAGLDSQRNWGTTKEMYLENIMNVWISLGKQPKFTDMNLRISRHSSSSYRHFFGSWTKALINFQDWIYQHDLENTDKNIYKPMRDSKDEPAEKMHITQRFPNLRLRFRVLQRDNFKCCACGASPAKDLTVELHIDHIVPWAKGGETVEENLQTLCSKCNLGKSDVL